MNPTIEETKLIVPTTNPSPRFPLGPAWWGAVMGTGIASTLTQLHAGQTTLGADLARFFLVAGWAFAVIFTIGFAIRCLRTTGAWAASMHGVGASAWGMVSMGILSIGSATATVLADWAPQFTTVSWGVDGALWVIGTALGLITTFGFSLALIRRRNAEPRPAWGLAVVPLMVSATCGAPFIAKLDSPVLAATLLAVLIFCFVTSLMLGIIIFAAAYCHHARVDRIPAELSASSWIPLGVVGQSTAAAQAISSQMHRFILPEAMPGIQAVANVYGIVMLCAAIPVVIFAVSTTTFGIANKMSFSPGWWALTFPVGTLSLGALNLGHSLQSNGYSAVGIGAWILLLSTWTVCAIASLRHPFLAKSPAPAN
ncbi:MULTISPECIES: TDT family transporter [Glutamicibacter]|nr:MULTISPECIES: TDT family transporter [Glutamicibacter]